jgi:N-acetylneuraminic acid mutarotase
MAGAAPAGMTTGGTRASESMNGAPLDPGSSTPGPAEGNAPSNDAVAPGQYAQRASLLTANSEMAVADVGGKIYVLGGYPASRDVQTTVQIYDPARDAWSLGAPMPVPTHHPMAVGFEGKIYSLGGQLEGDVNTERAFALDTTSDEWTELAPMPTARGGGGAARIDDRIYVAGGRPQASNAFEVYDIGDDAWTVLPNLPLTFNQRNHLSAAAIGGKVYVAGGRYDGGGFASPMTASLDVYDPATNSWTPAAAMPRPRGGVNGVIALGCFHVWGGEGSNIGEPNDVFPDHDVYDPTTDTWTSLPPLPVPIHGVTGASFIDGLIYMPGGGTTSGGNSGSVIHQVYRPDLTCGDGDIIADVVR